MPRDQPFVPTSGLEKQERDVIPTLVGLLRSLPVSPLRLLLARVSRTLCKASLDLRLLQAAMELDLTHRQQGLHHQGQHLQAGVFLTA